MVQLLLVLVGSSKGRLSRRGKDLERADIIVVYGWQLVGIVGSWHDVGTGGGLLVGNPPVGLVGAHRIDK